MANDFAAPLLERLTVVSAPPQQLGAAHHGLMGPMLGNLLVGGAAAVVTIVCFIVAARLLIHPGERDPSHPKYRILAADR